MHKQDWIEVISILDSRDWIDWLIIIASITTPIIMLMSVYLSVRATRIANEATMLNVKMYKEQRKEEERLFLPNFQVLHIASGNNSRRFRLKNMNINRPISYSNFESNLPKENFDYTIISDYEIEFNVKRDHKETDSLTIYLYYRTLNHRSYRSEIVLRYFKNDEMTIQIHDIKNLDEKSEADV